MNEYVFNGVFVELIPVQEETKGIDKSGYERIWKPGSWIVKIRDTNNGFYASDIWVQKNIHPVLWAKFKDKEQTHETRENTEEIANKEA